MSLTSFVLKVKRSNSPIFIFLKKVLRFFFTPYLPPLPKWMISPLRYVYEIHFLAIALFRSMMTILYRNPLFQSRCATFGRRVTMDGLPYVDGHATIHIGNEVKLGGKISIHSGGVFEQPNLILKDRCSIGWRTSITVNKEVLIEEDVLISFDCRISDSDGHRREADLRAAGVPPDPSDVRPVRICRYAFIGNGAHIMKGVTIGEGATVAANSVVISNVPPYSLALGNPAEILFRNYGLPSTAIRKKRTAAQAQSVAPRDIQP
jgi:acetyltransferase-like isoleucine patch superfamily enzyme